MTPLALPPSVIRPARTALMVGILLLAASGSAWSQWQWRDASGKRVFSDTPPPASVPERDILKRPGAPASSNPPALADTVPAAPPATAPAANAPAAPRAGDPQLEARKQQLEKAEADKRKADEKAAEEKAARVRAQNCENARKNKAALDSGVRLTMPNARGEAEFLDEAGRATQMRQADAAIRENCR